MTYNFPCCFFSLLCEGVMSASFKQFGKVLIARFKDSAKKTSKNISVFVNNCGRNIGLLKGFLLLSLFISSIMFSLSTSWKVNFEFFDFSFNAMILGWFLCFKIALKTGSLTFLKLGLKFSYSGIFNFFSKFEKNLFSTSAVSESLLFNYPYSLRWILSLFIDLSDRGGLTVF